MAGRGSPHRAASPPLGDAGNDDSPEKPRTGLTDAEAPDPKKGPALHRPPENFQPGRNGTGTKNRPPTVFSALFSLSIAAARSAISNWPATVRRQNHQSI